MGRLIRVSESLILKCSECENEFCAYAKKYVPIDSKEGCIREVSEEVFDKYFYLINEKWPMIISSEYPMTHINSTYQEIVQFLYSEIYTAPVKQKISKSGKVKFD